MPAFQTELCLVGQTRAEVTLTNAAPAAAGTAACGTEDVTNHWGTPGVTRWAAVGGESSGWLCQPCAHPNQCCTRRGTSPRAGATAPVLVPAPATGTSAAATLGNQRQHLQLGQQKFLDVFALISKAPKNSNNFAVIFQVLLTVCFYVE